MSTTDLTPADEAAWREYVAASQGTGRANPAYVPADVELLAKLLAQAKDAHTAWEAEHGADEDWPRWYAEYLLGHRDERGELRP